MELKFCISLLYLGFSVDENPLIENNGPPKSPLKKEQIDEEIKLYAKNILLENIRLQNLVTFLEAENHRISIKSASYDDHISILENHNETISTKLEDVRYELDKSWIREEKLDYRLAEVRFLNLFILMETKLYSTFEKSKLLKFKRQQLRMRTRTRSPTEWKQMIWQMLAKQRFIFEILEMIRH